MSELLSTFAIDWRLLLAQAINFGIAFGVLWYFLYGPVMRMIDERRKMIEKGVDDAKKAAHDRERSKEEANAALSSATREGDEIIARARTSADERGAKIVDDARTKAEATLKEAQQRADEAHRQMMEKSAKEIARASILAAEKIIVGKKK